MIVIPQKLFDSEDVKILLRKGNNCILQKRLNESLLGREGYISQHVISIVRQGNQKIRTYDDEVISVNAGEILCIPRGLYYITDLVPTNGEFQSLLFYFDNQIIDEFLATSRITSFQKERSLSHLKFAGSAEIDTFLDSLLTIYSRARIGARVLNLKILELLHLINDLVGHQILSNYLFKLSLPEKRNIKTFMAQNFDKPLKIEDYAYLTGRSESSFRRDFKSLFDLSPNRWIKNQRLNKAVELVAEGQSNVTQLAYEVGYENISYFIQEFKGHTGQSPKQYILQKKKDDLLNL